MNHLPLIIQREYLNKVRNKSFIVMTILSPIIMIVLVAFVAYLSQLNNNKERTIAVLDESGFLEDAFQSTDNTTYKFLDDLSLEAAKKETEANGDYGLLYIEDVDDFNELGEHVKFFSTDSPSLMLMSDLENNIQKELSEMKLIEEGIDIDKIKESKLRVNIAQESFVGEKTSKIDSIAKLFFGCAAGYLLFMFIIIYGNMIMRSVIEEKTNRIIEVIISSVKPTQLMLGKIIGTSLAGITQFLIWLVLGGVLVTIVSAIFGVDVLQTQPVDQETMRQAMENTNSPEFQSIILAINNLPIGNLVVAFLLFFLGGYLLYSSLYAAIGAAVDSETDTQQFLLPILMPLILAVYIGVFTVIEDPHGTVSTIFSFIPFTSPVVMLMRIPFGVPVWQQLLSFGLLVATFLFAVWFASKIYRVGILMYGKKPSYKELIKWIKY